MARLLLISLILLPRLAWGLEEDDIPQHVCVLPVFLVPRGQVGPTELQIEKLTKHLKIAQSCYKKMLKDRETFSIAELEPQIVNVRFSLEDLKMLPPKKLTTYYLNNLFRELKLNRFNCPYVFLTITMNPDEAWPVASGRPINGGFNNGGGIVLLSSNKLDTDNPLIQGSMQHEMGHAFGLVHVDCYGYDQYKNKSIMSYNKGNYWSGYNPPKEPGNLIPEDIRNLSMNKRVFPKLYFDYKQDVPKGYKLGKLVRLSYNTGIPGQKPYEIKVKTNSGQDNRTNVKNIVHSYIRPNRKPKNGTGLVEGTMWMSSKIKNGWADVELEFPIAVRMNKIYVHSQCGGGLYPVKSIRIEADTDGFVEIGRNDNVVEDKAVVSFTEVKARRWRLFFKPGESGQVVIRGLQFFSSRGEIFCPHYPTYLITRKN